MAIFNTITHVETIPAVSETVEEWQEYKCSKCDFSSTYASSDVTDHYAREHARAEVRKVGRFTFGRFESEEDFDTFKSHPDSGNDGIYGTWQGPGWYEEESTSEPCGRGCCTRFYMRLRPAHKTVQIVSNKINELQTEMDLINNLIVNAKD